MPKSPLMKKLWTNTCRKFTGGVAVRDDGQVVAFDGIGAYHVDGEKKCEMLAELSSADVQRREALLVAGIDEQFGKKPTAVFKFGKASDDLMPLLKKEDGSVDWVAVHPEGAAAVAAIGSVGSDTTKLRFLVNGKAKTVDLDSPGNFTVGRFDNLGRLVVATTKELVFFDATGKRTHAFDAPNGMPVKIKVAGRFVLTKNGIDRSIHVFDEKGECFVFEDKKLGVDDAALTADGKYLLAATPEGWQLIAVASGKRIAKHVDKSLGTQKQNDSAFVGNRLVTSLGAFSYLTAFEVALPT